MIKSIKYTALTLILGLMQIAPVHAASGMLKRVCKPATAAGVAGLVSYKLEKERETAVDNMLKSLTDLDSEKSFAMKQILTDKGPVGLDQGLIKSIIFKQLAANKYGVSDECAIGHKDRKAIAVTVDPFPSDFLLLHELGHHYHNHHAWTGIFNQASYGVSTGSVLYYLLNGNTKKRFMIAPLVWALGNVTIGFSLQAIFRYHEIQADKFAITCLKNHADLDALKLGKADLLASQPLVNEIVTTRLGLSMEELDEIESKSKLSADFIKFCANPHPEIKDRIKKIDQAIAELRARELKE